MSLGGVRLVDHYCSRVSEKCGDGAPAADDGAAQPQLLIGAHIGSSS